MLEVKRAEGQTKKVKIAVHRGTGSERLVVFGAEPVRFGELPPEIEEELTSAKPRLVAEEIEHERTVKLPPRARTPRQLAAIAAAQEPVAGGQLDNAVSGRPAAGDLDGTDSPRSEI